MADVPLHIHVDTDAVAAKVMKAVRLDIARARAEVAEEIAQAIENELRNGGDGFIWNYALDRAIEIARNHAVAAGTDTAEGKQHG